PADTGPATKVTANELAKAYGENVVAADGKYKGKTLEVSGDVLRVVRSKPGKVTVELDAEEGDGLIRCDFPAKESQTLGAVKAGLKVVIRGRCAGNVDEFVTLDGCSLVK